jgi:tight adherence protein B
MFQGLGKFYDKLAESLVSAGIKIKTDDFILYFLYVSLTLFVITLIKFGLMYSILSIVVLVVLIKFFLNNRKSSIRFKTEQEFGIFATDLAVVLRVNPNFMSAVSDVTKYTKPILREHLDKVITNVNSGMTIEYALLKFKDDVIYSSIITSWIDSILYAMNTGANLIDVCASSAEKINKKLQRGLKVKSLTSNTKGLIIAILGIILIFIPILISSSPDFQSAYSTTMGHIILSIVLGSFVITTYLILKSIDKMIKM